MIETTAEQNFMPEAHQIAPYISEATLIAVCSPLNPTGTTMSKKQLSDICELVLEENKKRKPGQKPVYLMYDQIYSMLTYNNTEHYNPVKLYPEMKNYTIFIDGLSKAYAATGVRVGWCFGPERVIGRMKALLDHIGAWAPKAEQWAVSEYIVDDKELNAYMSDIKSRLLERLQGIYVGLKKLKSEGFSVDAIEPQSAIYLTAQFNLKGKTMPNGITIENTTQITSYLLEEANLGIVPFYAFGANRESNWYRISVGTLKIDDVPLIIENLRVAFSKLK
jgi:aspartate aminotransferase